jgi:hypothetical protein
VDAYAGDVITREHIVKVLRLSNPAQEANMTEEVVVKEEERIEEQKEIAAKLEEEEEAKAKEEGKVSRGRVNLESLAEAIDEMHIDSVTQMMEVDFKLESNAGELRDLITNVEVRHA